MDEALRKILTIRRNLAELQAHGLPLHAAQSIMRTQVHGQTQHIQAAKLIPTAKALWYDTQIRHMWDDLFGVAHTDLAWTRANLPQQGGGCTLGAIGIGSRTGSAFLAGLSRCVDYVCRHCHCDGPDQLFESAANLKQCKLSAVAALRNELGPHEKVPWEYVRSQPFKQREVNTKVNGAIRKALLARMSSEATTAFRSAGGTGAGAFLQVPKDPDLMLDDNSFRIAYARRLGGGLCPTSATQKCRHNGTRGPCGSDIDLDGRHCRICPIGGFVVGRHDRCLRWLASWLNEGRTTGPALVEQLVPEENGRMDIVFQHGGHTWWVDLAVVSAVSSNPKACAARAQADGAAARAEEGQKRTRYHGRAYPFVIEALGRPGQQTKTFIRRFVQDCADDFNTSTAEAWCALSCILQSSNALAELTCYGNQNLEQGACQLFVP